MHVTWSQNGPTLLRRGIHVCHLHTLYSLHLSTWRAYPLYQMAGVRIQTDMLHLPIFGLLRWAYMPKEVQHGKLESKAVRVHMLG